MSSNSKELFNVTTHTQALEKMITEMPLPELESEPCALESALGRFLATDVISPEQIPPFARSTMDGYAVKAIDTFGASEGNPAYLEVIGRISMGEAPSGKVGRGQAMEIPTGGMLPPGADAVVMVEYTNLVNESTVEITKAVAPGDNLIKAGEDIKQEEVMYKAGRRLRADDLGALAAVGISEVKVFIPLKVGILSTGNEVVDVDVKPKTGQIRDINYYALSGLVQNSGAQPIRLGICPDDAGALKERLAEGVSQCHIVLISGGSSVGVADLTPAVINELGKPGVLVHGLAVKPGKPTISALVGNVPVFGLPGHPVSALDIYRLMVDPLISYMYSGKVNLLLQPRVRAKLSRSLASVAGREDRIRVVLEPKGGELWATPLLGKSGLISLMVKSDGVAVIPFEAEGVGQGDEVTVELF